MSAPLRFPSALFKGIDYDNDYDNDNDNDNDSDGGRYSTYFRFVTKASRRVRAGEPI